MSRPSTVITLVADGARPDVLDGALCAGALPALARLREEGTAHTITTVFPSVTGPAYTPFLVGRHPGTLGVPGLRWFDRARTASRWPYARSYVGAGMRHIDGDLDARWETMFERTARAGHAALGALSVVRRGLPKRGIIGRGARFVTRTGITHFRGDVRGWLAIDRDIADAVVARVRRDRPAYVFAALTGVDKTSHAAGYDAPSVREALTIVDETVARLRADAERDGRWRETQLWLVSDHGHARVEGHDDLAGALASDHRVLAHPRVLVRRPEIAVMVSGNAMAHLYVELERRTRPFWPALSERWTDVAAELLARPSVDLMLLPLDERRCEIRSRARGVARLEWNAGYTYRPITGDPLGIGEQSRLSEIGAWDATRDSDYPDALVQIARLAACGRSGDIIVSAAAAWDFRARYEPIPHHSTHGALHREHMLVPLITNAPLTGTPRRTVDVAASACTTLGCPDPALEGESLVAVP